MKCRVWTAEDFTSKNNGLMRETIGGMAEMELEAVDAYIEAKAEETKNLFTNADHYKDVRITEETKVELVWCAESIETKEILKEGRVDLGVVIAEGLTRSEYIRKRREAR